MQIRKAIRFILPALPLLLAACASPYVSRRDVPQDELAGRQAVVDYAQSLVGTRDLAALGGGFKNDCSGFVNGVYQHLDRKIKYGHVSKNSSLSESLYRTLLDKNLAFNEYYPNIADAVFFRNTTENSTSDDITHVGLVEAVGADGTVGIIHYSSGSVNRIKMNLRHPRERTDGDGKVINDYVRRSASGQPRRDYLAGNLFAAYGDVFRYTEP